MASLPFAWSIHNILCTHTHTLSRAVTDAASCFQLFIPFIWCGKTEANTARDCKPQTIPKQPAHPRRSVGPNKGSAVATSSRHIGTLSPPPLLRDASNPKTLVADRTMTASGLTLSCPNNDDM